MNTGTIFPLAQSAERTYYEFVRLESLDQWWHWFAFLIVVVAVLAHVVFWYRRDGSELPRPLSVALVVLRISAFAGLLIFFLDLQKRSEQQIVRPSRLAVLIDSSLSMNLQTAAAVDSESLSETRMASVLESLKSDPWLTDLTQNHDTTVYRFDQTTRPIELASFTKPAPTADNESDRTESLRSVWATSSMVAWIGTSMAILASVLLLIAIIVRVSGNPATWGGYVALAGVVLIIGGTVVIASAVLRASDLPWRSLWASQSPPVDTLLATPDIAADTTTSPSSPNAIAWSNLLSATGTESRIGDAVKSILDSERSSPLAGIVLVSDGQNNSGSKPRSALALAQVNGVPIYTIGLGSAASPRNVRVVDVEAPKRVFPSDAFQLTALLQSTGFENETISIQLRRIAANETGGTFSIEEERRIDLLADDNLQPIDFQVEPPAIGDWVYDVKILPPPKDSNDKDNSLDTSLRVVEPRSKVLIIAGGPTREYQFVRNLLYRDETVQSSVFLQTGGPGISQEAQQLLTDFPRTLEEMLEYDTVLSFDTDWMTLDIEQIALLERWVSTQAGGLVLVAGPVATPRWTGTEGNGNRRAELLRQMSPTILNSRGTRLVSMGRFESEVAFPLVITDDGWRTDFLRVVPGSNPRDSLDASRRVWDDFSGVYSFFSCYEAKPGASVLAYFGDPAMTVDGQLPIYLASQFFGAGRVVFQGGGEMWRIREDSVDYFDQYYTKLVRWAGQGRLLRDSDRGQLLLDREQAFVGEQVSVRAVLKDEQFEPLVTSQIEAQVVSPDKRRQPLRLLPLQDASQPGVYVGQFLTNQNGNYTVELPIGGLANQEILSQQVSVRIPAREIQRPQRNDILLAELATKSGGEYFIGFDSANQLADNPSGENAIPDATNEQTSDDAATQAGTNPLRSMLASKIAVIDQTTFLPGAPDREFQLRLMTMLMSIIVGSLAIEWLLRRINKLA